MSYSKSLVGQHSKLLRTLTPGNLIKLMIIIAVVIIIVIKIIPNNNNKNLDTNIEILDTLKFQRQVERESCGGVSSIVTSHEQYSCLRPHKL